MSLDGVGREFFACATQKKGEHAAIGHRAQSRESRESHPSVAAETVAIDQKPGTSQ